MLLDLKTHSTNTVIISSLAWNAIRDSLVKLGKWELLEHIESVKVTDTRITVKTGKPIVNAELSNNREMIKKRIEESFRSFGITETERKIFFI